MEELALLGGKPVRERPIPWVSTMGPEETKAVLEVMESGTLSAFLGKSGEEFLGGPKVREIERNFAGKFGAAYAISVNSATTALHTAVAACQIGPGDEVLVTPFSMVATATAIVMNNAVPVFVDIDPKTFNLDPEQMERWITPRTKAVVVTNLFGLPADLERIVTVAKKYGLFVIEDNAQSPGAAIRGKFAGTIGDLGVFSLNYHKVIHSGEGGIILTNNKDLAYRCQLVRNHGEVILDETDDEETTVIGSNYRMSELHAAIGIEQLKKLDGFLEKRRKLARMVTEGLQSFEGLSGAYVPEGYSHSYYVYPILYHEEIWGMKRETFAEAMKAEGFPLGVGYVKPIYNLIMYRTKKVYNRTQFPFSLIDRPVQEYQPGLCPVAEEMYERKLLIADICRLPYTERDIADFLTAIQKIWNGKERLADAEKHHLYRA